MFIITLLSHVCSYKCVCVCVRVLVDDNVPVWVRRTVDDLFLRYTDEIPIYLYVYIYNMYRREVSLSRYIRTHT
jgi:hypothetical protein